MDAPYFGGFSPGGVQFAVDGDFTVLAPCAPPIVSYPMKGDSVFSNLDTLTLDFTQNPPQYINIPLGTFPNIQPWSSNQRVIVIEQEFMVAMEYWTPPPLNTPYFDGWSIGWTGQLTNGQPTEDLSAAILVEIGELEDMGQGIVKVKLRFATVPPVRNEVEQFSYVYPGLANWPYIKRFYYKNVNSRVQYDYFVFDDFDILGTPLFPGGNRLDGSTGLYPSGLIQLAQGYYAPVANAVSQACFLNSDGALSDPPSDMSSPGSTPTNQQWFDWLLGNTTSNGLSPEIVAEGSTLRRWMGNIFERRTRYVLVN